MITAFHAINYSNGDSHKWRIEQYTASIREQLLVIVATFLGMLLTISIMVSFLNYMSNRWDALDLEERVAYIVGSFLASSISAIAINSLFPRVSRLHSEYGLRRRGEQTTVETDEYMVRRGEIFKCIIFEKCDKRLDYFSVAVCHASLQRKNYGGKWEFALSVLDTIPIVELTPMEIMNSILEKEVAYQVPLSAPLFLETENALSLSFIKITCKLEGKIVDKYYPFKIIA